LRVRRGEDGMLRMGEIMSELARKGITRVLVEGGQKIITSLIRAELVARVSWFRAPSIIGEDGVRAIGALGFEELGMVRRWRRVSWEQLGEDTLECFVHGD
jgi:diaminohydroxyphosphoribosylaminopyrimidine deaminase/5-amino-6-(5-phosphoribosylamino)uracil reductase